MGKKNAKEHRRLKKLRKLENKKSNNNTENISMEDMQSLGKRMNWISYSMGKPVAEDDNRVIVGKYLKSSIYDRMKKDYIERFIGGFKTLHKGEFFKKVVLNNQTLIGIEEELKSNPERCFHSTGEFSGIIHYAIWSAKHNCFLAWSFTPNQLNVVNATH